MAESADILSAPHQQVILPNPAAGCSMADMANIAEVEECWEMLHDVLGTYHGEAGIIPITYMNSAANLKAFCGRNGGVVCTSSNAPAVMRWAFTQGQRVLFFPDEHLGRNTALKYGIPEAQMFVWNPRDPMASNTADDEIAAARVILWKGYCTTHMRFNVQQIEKARAEYPGIRVMVHPECRREVVEAADLNGSTEYIIQQIEQAPAGSPLGGRHRDQPGAPPGPGASRPAHLLPRPGRLPLLDHVPHPSRLPCLGAGSAARRRSHQPGEG